MFIKNITGSGTATAAARAALPSPTSACWVFRVSVIHQTLTWTTGFLTCVCDHAYACMYTRRGGGGGGVGTSTASQPNIFDSEKLSQIFLVLLTQAGFEPLDFGS